MLCSRCKERTAVVFVTKIENGKKINEGLCLQCAIELGISPAIEAAEKMGITPEDIESMSRELTAMFDEKEGAEALEPVDDSESEERGEGDFEAGGTAAFPFLQNLFGGEQQKTREKKTDKKSRDKKRKHLEQYCINLVRRAKDGEIDAIIGRDREIARVIQILNRRSKNNPCLIGEPGVGKTAVAEGLALRIAKGEVPAKLADKEIYLLDLTALVAGTQFRGQFESRMKSLIEEVKQLGNVILFIDEVHNLVGAGDAEGSMNAANIMKPALSRGEVQVIGATTFSEYRKHIEKDAALERRFQPVTVEEPSIDGAVDIMRGIKGYYEKFHGVSIDDETVREAVLLSERYITDRYLPDKAIDLIDEAASAASIGNEGYNRRVRAEKEYAALSTALEETQPDGTPEAYEKIADLKAQKCKLEEELTALRAQPALKISREQLADVIEIWTGIPAARIREDELTKLRCLGDRLKKRVIGQDEAVDALVAAIRKNRVGLSQGRRPVSFIFTGPTGVGKTELVKQLAADLFDSPETLIRLDMSEFMEKHAVSRLIGAPPGYVGYDEAGQLTEKIRRKPYSVVLFDEIEKAHPDVLNILLQILDDGRVTDAHGRTVNFENTIIVMTSNAGSERRDSAIGFNRTEEQREKEKAMKALSDFLRPEFLNRVDDVIAFRSLSKQDLRGIARLMLDDLSQAMKRQGRSLRYDDAAVELLVEKAYDPRYNARSLRRLIDREVEGRIADHIINAESIPVGEICLTAEDGALQVR